jgi:O-antigen/teichoic acid export membrane protein
MTAATSRGAAGVGARRLLGLGAARGAASLLAFAGVLLVARLLDPAELGRWSLALAVQGYALHLAEFGLRSVVTTELAGAGAAWPTLLHRYLRLRLLLAVLVLAATLAGTALLRPDALTLVALATLCILPVAAQLDWIALVDDRLGLAALPLLVRPAAFALLLLVGPPDAGPLRVATCYLAAWCLASAASWAALRRPGLGRPGAAVAGATRMLARGTPLMLVTLTNQAQLSADLLVVGWTLGAPEAGDYYLASQIAVAALLFANAANQLALARLPALAGQPARFAAELAREARHLLRTATLLAAALGLAGPWLLPLLFGAEHAGAALALLCLLPWLVLQHLTNLLQGALTAAGRERAVLGGNLALLLALAPALGLAAAGGALAGFAAARSAAELVRLAVLRRSLRRAGLAPRAGSGQGAR